MAYLANIPRNVFTGNVLYRLSPSEVTKAVRFYCRAHNHSADFVRTNSAAMHEALVEGVKSHFLGRSI